MGDRTRILRADLDAERVAWGDIDSRESLPAVHPGEVLRHEFLDPLDLSANALALALRVPANRITGILKGERGVTAETALRLSRHFGTSAGFWLNLQKSYELEVTEQSDGPRIRAEVMPRFAASPHRPPSRDLTEHDRRHTQRRGTGHSARSSCALPPSSLGPCDRLYPSLPACRLWR